MLTDVYLHHHQPRQIALVAYGDDEPTCHRALTALHTALTRDGRGPEVGPVLWVDGDGWTDLIAGATGTVSSSARTRMDAEFTLLGRRAPAETREELAAALHGDPTDVSELMPEATARVLGLDPTALRAEREWLGARVDTFVRDRELLSDHDAARVLAALHDTGARDAVESRMSRDHAAVLSDFWSDLVRRAPADVRDAPAVMLALSSYLGGNGAQAWIALDQMTGPHPLAEVVATALERAIDPRVLEQAFRAEATSALMQRAGLLWDTDTGSSVGASTARHSGRREAQPRPAGTWPVRPEEEGPMQRRVSPTEQRLADLIADATTRPVPACVVRADLIFLSGTRES